MEGPLLVALKVDYKGEIHRLRVDVSAYTFEELSALFASTFALAPNSFVIQYKDTEGDVLTVTSEAELKEAFAAYVLAKDYSRALRFSAVSRAQVAFQENVAEPVLKAIEKLVETLKTTMDKVKQEQWAQRAQSGVEHTGEAIKSGVGHTGEVLNRAAKDARESLEHTGEVLTRASLVARESLSAAGKSIQEIPFEKVLKETGENLKLAAESIGAFATELAEEVRKLPQVASPAAPAPTTPVETPAQQPAPAAEAEWEQVEQAAPAPVEEAPVVVVAEPEVVEVVTAPAVSEEEQKWASQIAVIRDIIPSVNALEIIDRLEQCNGNVEVVLNSLMEEM